jgi:hypothetical protein
MDETQMLDTLGLRAVDSQPPRPLKERGRTAGGRFGEEVV